MMTSWFGNRNVRNGVSIAQSHPQGWTGTEIKLLAPSWPLIRLAKQGRFAEYVEGYNVILESLDPQKVYDVLENATLLCWERPGEFCHRRLVAEWIESALDVVVFEL